MRIAYIGIAPRETGIEVEFKDLPLINPLSEETYICYSSDIPEFSPQNFILVMPSASPAKLKKLDKEKGYQIHKSEFQMKRLFNDKNRGQLFKDIKKIEPLHLYSISRNYQKIPDFNFDMFSQCSSLIYSVDNKFIKAALVYGIKPSIISFVRY